MYGSFPERAPDKFIGGLMGASAPTIFLVIVRLHNIPIKLISCWLTDWLKLRYTLAEKKHTKIGKLLFRQILRNPLKIKDFYKLRQEETKLDKMQIYLVQPLYRIQEHIIFHYGLTLPHKLLCSHPFS